MLNYFERQQLIFDSTLKPSERLILLALNSFADSCGEFSSDVISTAAEMTNYKDFFVHSSIEAMCKQNDIEIVERWIATDHNGIPCAAFRLTVYRILFNNLNQER